MKQFVFRKVTALSELVLRKHTASVNEIYYLGKENCHVKQYICYLWMLAALANASFIHIEMFPRAALRLIKIKPLRWLLSVIFPSWEPFQQQPGHLFSEMICLLWDLPVYCGTWVGSLNWYWGYHLWKPKIHIWEVWLKQGTKLNGEKKIRISDPKKTYMYSFKNYPTFNLPFSSFQPNFPHVSPLPHLSLTPQLLWSSRMESV